MRPLKRSLTIVSDPLTSADIVMSPEKDVSDVYGQARGRSDTIEMLNLPLPCDPKHGSMDPPLQPPPWKRATVATNPQGALQLPIPRSPPRLLTPRVSWSDIVSQSQEQEPRSPISSSRAPLGGASSPRTPYNRSRQPPSPPCRMPLRRRPPSDDEGFFPHDENEGRFKREFDEVTSIGKGQFSTVFRARNKIDRCMYAVKRTQEFSRSLQEWQLREVFALAAVGIEADACRNIVRYFSSWLEDGKLHIQTELCECSLRDRLAERCRRGTVSDPRFQEKDLILVLRDVSCGLAVLHARNFVHLDIKPDNILVSRGAEGCYKIADLGLAVAAMGSGCDDISEGDCRYLAKEVLKGDLSGLPKADVFSLGLVLYELAINPKPLPCNGDEWHELRTGRLDVSLVPILTEPLLTLLHRMVHALPAERPTCEEISRHPSVAPIDGLLALQEEMRRRTLEAERNKQLADEYWAELLSMKRQELLSGGANQPSVGGRPVASPVGPTPPVLGRYNTA